MDMPRQKIIDELKLLTAKSKELSLPMNFFMDHIAEDPDFRKNNDIFQENQDFYQAMIHSILPRYCSTETTVKSMYLVKHRESTLVHGSALLSNKTMMSIYFFEDINTGIAFVPNFSGDSSIYRLTAFISDKKLDSAFTMPYSDKSEH